MPRGRRGELQIPGEGPGLVTVTADEGDRGRHPGRIKDHNGWLGPDECANIVDAKLLEDRERRRW